MNENHLREIAQGQAQRSVKDRSKATPLPQLATVHGGELHVWPTGDGVFHKVPYGFCWPSGGAFSLWDLWFNGNPALKICPYKFIDPSKDLVDARCKVNRARTSKVIAKLTQIAVDRTLITSSRGITATNYTEVFDNAYPILIEELYESDKQRSNDLNMYTLANRLYAHTAHTPDRDITEDHL